MRAASDVPGSMSVHQVLPVLDALSVLGLDPARALVDAGLRRDQLASPNARILASSEFAFWDAIEAQAGDPLVGVRIGQVVEVGALGAFEYLIRNSATLRDAVDRAQRFERLMDDHSRIALVESACDTRLRMFREGGYAHPARGVECLFAALARTSGELLGQPVPLEISFAHPAPCDAARFAEALSCPVRFDQPFHEIALDRDVADRPVLGADHRLGQVLEVHLQHELQQLPAEAPFLQQVRDDLLQLLQSAAPSIEQLARRQGQSPRTLRRRLEAHGTTYSQLLDEVRQDQALRLLPRSELTIEGIAARLGFSEASTFYRAFKRWTGTTPAAYRDGHRPDAESHLEEKTKPRTLLGDRGFEE